MITGVCGKAMKRTEIASFKKRGELSEGKGVDALAARTFDFQCLLQFLKKQAAALAAQFNVFIKSFRRFIQFLLVNF